MPDHLYQQSSGFRCFRLPNAILGDEAVEQNGEFAGDRDERNLGRLARGLEAIGEALELRHQSRRGQCGEMERSADDGAATADLSLTDELA